MKFSWPFSLTRNIVKKYNILNEKIMKKTKINKNILNLIYKNINININNINR